MTATSTYTYTISDIETVMRRFRADMIMIAQSTGALSENFAKNYANDAEELAKRGFLRKVDVSC